MKAPWTIRSVSGKMFGVQFRLSEMCRYLLVRVWFMDATRV